MEKKSSPWYNMNLKAKGSKAFLKVVSKAFDNDFSTERVSKLKREYPGLSKEKYAEILTKRASRKAMVEGITSASAITYAQFKIAATKGAAAPWAVPAIIGAWITDISVTTTIHLNLMFDIANIYECPYKDDSEEDMWYIFKYALGLNTADGLRMKFHRGFSDSGKSALKKFLRQNLKRRRFQDFVRSSSSFGRKVAKFLAEKHLVKIVGAINIIAGGVINRNFTYQIGKKSKINAKIRSLSFDCADEINRISNEDRVILISIISTIGNCRDNNTDYYLALLRHTQLRLDITVDEIEEIETYTKSAGSSYNEKFKKRLSNTKNPKVKRIFFEVMIIASAIDLKMASKEVLQQISLFSTWLNLPFEESMISEKIKYLKN